MPTFSRRTQFPHAPNRWTLALHQARRAGRPLLELTHTNPTLVGLSPRVALPSCATYMPEAQGLACARKALAEALGWPKLWERLCLTSGSSEALGVLLKVLADPGDEVLVGMPGYPLCQTLVELEGLHALPFPLRLESGAFRWDIPLLEERLTARTRAVVATSPQSPVGCCLLDEEVLALEAFCAAHGLALIIDEVFALKRHSLAGRPWQCLTFVLGGLSKWLGLPQHKLAWTWVLGPTALAEEAIQRWLWAADAYLCLSTPVQEAVPTWLPLAESFQRAVEARCQNNHACLRRLWHKGAAWDIWPREAGWTTVLRVPQEPSEEALALKLLEAGVAVWPGYFFDIPVAGFLVLSLLAEEAAFATAATQMVRAMEVCWENAGG